jgi:hypothetical protein
LARAAKIIERARQIQAERAAGMSGRKRRRRFWFRIYNQSRKRR